MTLFFNAIFKYNVVVYSGLGLFLVLAGQQSFANALGLSIAFLLNMILSPLIILAINSVMDEEIKFLSYLVVFATISTFISMLMQVFFPVWIQGVELYLPLIAISGILQYRSELIQAQSRVQDVLIENIATAIGFMLIVVPLSMVSELLGTNGLRLPSFIDSNMDFFSFDVLPADFQLGIFTGPYGYLGSFILLGLMLAMIKFVQLKKGNRA